MKRSVLICAPVHEEEHIFKLYLEHLRRLNIPDDVEIEKMFYLHNCEDLKHLMKNGEKYSVYDNTTNYKKDEQTHFWKEENFKDVVLMKNKLIEYAIMRGFDYILYVDSDLMLHPNTLIELLNADKDMIAEIFWTDWQKNGFGEMPNCWNLDHYSIDKNEFNKWKNTKGNYRVGMTGACTLIKRKVFGHPVVNWNPVYNSSISVWEDRAFCTRVAVADFEIWINNTYPAIHLYRNSEYKKFVDERGGIYE